MASSVFDIKEHVIPGEHTREYARAKANSQEETLVIHVKQYTPKGNGAPQKGDLTIIGAHANGFPKVRPIPFNPKQHRCAHPAILQSID